MLSKKEFFDYLYWLIPYLPQEKREIIFKQTDKDRNDLVSYNEFKENYPNLIQMTRIKNVIKANATVTEILFVTFTPSGVNPNIFIIHIKKKTVNK